MKELFRRRIKQLRLYGGWSQVEMAKMLSTEKTTIQAWEYGTRYPGPDKLDEIAKAFQQPVSWLFLDPDALPEEPWSFDEDEPGQLRPEGQAGAPESLPLATPLPAATPEALIGQMMHVLQGLQTERLALLEEVRASRLERQAFLAELQATREERKRWRRMIARQQQAAESDEVEKLQARVRALEGELSAPPVPGSGGVQEAAG